MCRSISPRHFIRVGARPDAMVMMVSLMIVFGLYLRGWRLALLGGGTFFYHRCSACGASGSCR